MVGWHHPLNGHEFEQAPGDDGQGSLESCSPWARKESERTERLNNNKGSSSIVVTSPLWFQFLGHLCWNTYLPLYYDTEYFHYSTGPSQVALVVKKKNKTNKKKTYWQCRRHKRHGFYPWIGKIPWRRKWQPTPVFLSGESRGQTSLVGDSLSLLHWQVGSLPLVCHLGSPCVGNSP